MAPRSATENRRIRRERYEQLLDSARTVFARKGLGATRTSDIARQAGVSNGLLYHYFSSKDEIFTALVERSLQGTRWVIDSAIARDGSAAEQLEWMFTYMVEAGRENPDYLIIAIQASSSDAVPDATTAVMHQHGEPIFADIVALIERAQAEGEVIDGDPRKLASALLASVQGLAIASVTGSADPEILPEPALILRMLRP